MWQSHQFLPVQVLLLFGAVKPPKLHKRRPLGGVGKAYGSKFGKQILFLFIVVRSTGLCSVRLCLSLALTLFAFARVGFSSYSFFFCVAHYRGRGSKQPFHRLFGRKLLLLLLVTFSLRLPTRSNPLFSNDKSKRCTPNRCTPLALAEARGFEPLSP